MSCIITYNGQNFTQEDFLEYLKSQIPTTQFTWARRAENSYEVSSKGDTRFSALNAKLKDGRTIEEAYQLDVKGYRAQGNNWRLGKGKAPLKPMSKEESWQAYKNLWRQFLEENPTLKQDLRSKASGKVLTDMFASTDISQARALAELLNERKSTSSTPNNPSEFTNHSGGALGSDIQWDDIGREFGMVNNKHYWTGEGVRPAHGNTIIDSIDYQEGRFESAKAAKRNFGYQYAAMKDSRLIRNWSQVKHSDAIFAIGKIVNIGEKIFPNQINDTRVAVNPSVTGGTGYAVSMAINNNKPVYVFDQEQNKWFTWSKEQNNFIEVETPILTKNFAGIGTRQINENGKQAIRDVYEKTFNQSEQGLNSPTGNKPKIINTQGGTDQIEAKDHFNFQNSETLLQSVVSHPDIPQSKDFITNRVNSSFNKYGYVDILTSGKNNFDFKSAVIKYILKDLGLEFKSDKELNNYLIKEKNEGRTFNLMQYVTLEELPDNKTRVKLNKRNLLLDSVEDFKPKSLGGLNFTSSGRDFESKNIFKNNIEQAFNCK